MPHQQHVVDVALEVQSEAAGDPHPGEWAYDDIGKTIQRRGGKTSIITPVTAHRAELVKRARIFLTAQNRDKARKRWFDATDDLLDSPLRDDVRRKISHGFEELRWRRTRSVFEPFAPNEDGLHSETPDLVFVDELWAFSAEQARLIKAGYVPAFATRSGQAWKMSTAGTQKSDWLNELRAIGRRAVKAGVRLGTAYFEWSLPEVIGGVKVEELPDDVLVQACIDYHPAVCHEPGCPGAGGGRPCVHGFTVRPAAIRSAWSEMNDRAEFIRAYGNLTQEDLSDLWSAIDRDVWIRQGKRRKEIPADARVGLGFAVAADSSEASVSAAWRDENGEMRTELIEYRAGAAWVDRWVHERIERHAPGAVATLGASPARAAADALKRREHEILQLSDTDYAAACRRHDDELVAGSWWHRNEPELLVAAQHAGWRKVGKSRAWEAGEEPITALESQTLAGWAFDHAPAPLGPFKIR